MTPNPNRLATYSIVRPPDTHTAPATCAQVDCDFYTNGWETIIDPTTDLGQRQTAYIEADRRPKTSSQLADGRIVYTFPPGVECFASHVRSLDREPLYLLRRGTAGRYTGPARHYDNPAQWVEDFADNQQKLTDIIH